MSTFFRVRHPLWFVAALFVGYFIFYTVRRFVKNKIYVSFILLIIALILVPLANTSHPFIFRGAYAALFLFLGGDLFLCERLKNYWVTTLCFVVVVLGSLFFATEMPKVDYKTFVPFTICSLAGAIMVMTVSEAVSDKQSIVSSILGYIGNHTMAILIWHFTCFKIVTAAILLSKGETLLMVAKFPTISGNTPNAYWLFYVIVGATVPLLINKLGESVKSFISSFIKKQSIDTK